jgi:hypothetical protein
MVMAFINGDFFMFFPGEESFQAIGAKVFNILTETDMKLEDI